MPGRRGPVAPPKFPYFPPLFPIFPHFPPFPPIFPHFPPCFLAMGTLWVRLWVQYPPPEPGIFEPSSILEVLPCDPSFHLGGATEKSSRGTKSNTLAVVGTYKPFGCQIPPQPQPHTLQSISRRKKSWVGLKTVAQLTPNTVPAPYINGSLPRQQAAFFCLCVSR